MSGLLNPYRGQIRAGSDVTALMWRVNSLESTVRVPTGDPSSPDGVFTKQWQHDIPFTPSVLSATSPHPLPFRRLFIAGRTGSTTVAFEDTYYATVEVIPTSIIPTSSISSAPTSVMVHVNIYSNRTLLYSTTFQPGSVTVKRSRGLVSGSTELFHPEHPLSVSPYQLTVPTSIQEVNPVWDPIRGFYPIGNSHFLPEPRFGWVDALGDFALYLSFWPVKNGRWGGSGTQSSPTYTGATDINAYMRAVGASLTFSSTTPAGLSSVAPWKIISFSSPGGFANSDEVLTGTSYGGILMMDPPPSFNYFRVGYFSQGTTTGDKPLDPTEWDRFLRDQTRENIGAFPPQESFTYTELPPLDTDALVCPDTLIQIRDAVEAVAPYFENPVTTNPYNFTNLSADNLYFLACGNRTQFGAQGGAKYTWTRTGAAMLGTPTYDIDIAEIEACVTKLEGSALA
jgi:hypothetical protein